MKTTIAATAAHGLKRGDVVNMGDGDYVVVSTVDTSFVLGPLPWWRRVGRALRRAWAWLARKVSR